MAPTRKHDKSFTCEVCKKTFAGDRARHYRKHAPREVQDMMKTECVKCGYSDLQRGNVLEHYVRAHTHETPHACNFTITNEQGRDVPCPFRCQSSSALTKHKKDVHNYKPRENKASNPAEYGKLEAYSQYVRCPPKWAVESASSASISATYSLGSSPMTASASQSMNHRLDRVYNASLSTLPYLHPSQYPRPPKQDTLEFTLLPGVSPRMNPMTGPHYLAPTPYGTTSTFAPMPQQWGTYPAPHYG